MEEAFLPKAYAINKDDINPHVTALDPLYYHSLSHYSVHRTRFRFPNYFFRSTGCGRPVRIDLWNLGLYLYTVVFVYA